MFTSGIIFSCLKHTLWDTFYTIGLVGIGFGVGFTIVALFVYDPQDSKLLEEDVDNRSESVIYCEKYWNEYNDLEEKTLSDEVMSQIENYMVCDELPFYGKTLVVYNHEGNQFHYYNNRGASIPYKMLATLARKFIVEHDCKSLYINISDELEKSKQVYDELNRKLNNGETLGLDGSKENNAEDVFVKKKTKICAEEANKYLIKENIIKFKYLGKLADCKLYIDVDTDTSDAGADASDANASGADVSDTNASDADTSDVKASGADTSATKSSVVETSNKINFETFKRLMEEAKKKDN